VVVDLPLGVVVREETATVARTAKYVRG